MWRRKVASRGSPMTPSARSRAASRCPVAHRNSAPTRWTSPASSAASSMVAASAASAARGFSHSTCLPAASACRVSPAWVRGGVAMVTAATPGRARASSIEVRACGMAKRRARSAVRPASRPTSPRTSKPTSRRAGTWVRQPKPVPTTTTPTDGDVPPSRPLPDRRPRAALLGQLSDPRKDGPVVNDLAPTPV